MQPNKTSSSTFNSTTHSRFKPISQKDVIERNGLGNGARKSVEYESILTIRPKNALSDYGNHKLVWYKLTTFHYRLGFSPDRSFCRHGGARRLAGQQMRNHQPLSQSCRLSSLPGSGGSE